MTTVRVHADQETLDYVDATISRDQSGSLDVLDADGELRAHYPAGTFRVARYLYGGEEAAARALTTEGSRPAPKSER